MLCYDNQEHCVVCGNPVPEGFMVCRKCEVSNDKENFKNERNIIRMRKIDIVLTSPTATMPNYETEASAGFDLKSDMAEFIIHPNEVVKVGTGISMALPDDCVGLIFPRSGISTKYGIKLANTTGIIDSDYRGEVIIALTNTSDKPFTVEHNMRIAQMVVVPYCRCLLNETNNLPNTSRGSGGFGSTGM